MDNLPFVRVLEKRGMTFEGCIREHLWLRDHSILKQEYTLNAGLKSLGHIVPS